MIINININISTNINKIININRIDMMILRVWWRADGLKQLAAPQRLHS